MAVKKISKKAKSKTITGGRKNTNKLSSKIPLLAAVAVATIVGSVGLFYVAQSQAASCYNSTFRVGSRGNCVSLLQRYTGASVDGRFGPKTKAAVIRFQQRNPGALRGDGVVGRNTWSKICRSLPASVAKYVADARRIGCKFSNNRYY